MSAELVTNLQHNPQAIQCNILKVFVRNQRSIELRPTRSVVSP